MIARLRSLTARWTAVVPVAAIVLLVLTWGRDLPGAAVIATVQIVLSLSLYVAYRVIFARVMTARGKGDTDVVVDPAK